VHNQVLKVEGRNLHAAIEGNAKACQSGMGNIRDADGG
jgi:hypothetical protein